MRGNFKSFCPFGLFVQNIPFFLGGRRAYHELSTLITSKFMLLNLRISDKNNKSLHNKITEIKRDVSLIFKVIYFE